MFNLSEKSRNSCDKLALSKGPKTDYLGLKHMQKDTSHQTVVSGTPYN
jgi:hypothetical protein